MTVAVAVGGVVETRPLLFNLRSRLLHDAGQGLERYRLPFLLKRCGVTVVCLAVRGQPREEAHVRLRSAPQTGQAMHTTWKWGQGGRSVDCVVLRGEIAGSLMQASQSLVEPGRIVPWAKHTSSSGLTG